MHHLFHRRDIIKAAAAMTGASLLARPLLAAATGRGFTHGVASGDPDAHSVVLWTRYVGEGSTPLTWEVARDAGFQSIMQKGTVKAAPDADHTAKAIADDLPAGQWFYYRFTAPDGSRSETGRSRTLPEGPVSAMKLAVFSCSNLPFGYFNAYAHAAAQNDFDLAVHLGDYFYEYPVGTYPSKDKSVPGRHLQPEHELISLADYRLRYNTYRMDPDLRTLHRNYPMISIWDDHEIANDCNHDGAQNHDPATEGSWEARKAAARQAYFEWLPMRGDLFRRYDFGDLASMFTLDTRLQGRTPQLDYADVLKDVDQSDPAAIAAALAAFRDGPWSDPKRAMMGPGKEAWLNAAMADSRRSGRPWQVLAQQVLVGRTYAPAALARALPPQTPGWLRARVQGAVLAASVGLPQSTDAWAGYPAARTRLVNGLRENCNNAVVLAGDSHNAWGSNLYAGGEFKTGARPAAVEFGGHSVSSPGLEGYFPIPEDQLAQALIDSSPELVWARTAGRGYMAVTVTPEAARCEWRFTGPEAVRSPALSQTHTMQVRASTGKGTARLETV